MAIACLVLFSCETERRPADILSKERMIYVLSEIYIAEEKVNRLALPRDSAEKVFQVVRAKIFDKTGIPDSTFKKSFDYYVDHPKELEQIYTVLIDSLQLMEARIPDQTLQQQ